MVIPSYSKAIFYDRDGKEMRTFEASASHYENFVTAVRSRKHEQLHADVLEGHISSALCHTANISYQLGSRMSPDQMRQELHDNKEMAEAFERMSTHLAANQVDLAKTPLTVGKLLSMDAGKETFIGNPSASKMLRRTYRTPFVVPEKV